MASHGIGKPGYDESTNVPNVPNVPNVLTIEDLAILSDLAAKINEGSFILEVNGVRHECRVDVHETDEMFDFFVTIPSLGIQGGFCYLKERNCRPGHIVNCSLDLAWFRYFARNAQFLPWGRV